MTTQTIRLTFEESAQMEKKVKAHLQKCEQCERECEQWLLKVNQPAFLEDGAKKWTKEDFYQRRMSCVTHSGIEEKND